MIAPVNAPREGYVVYDNTRRAAAGRRLDRTLTSFREAGIAATGHVVDNDPLTAVKDAIAIEEPDELIVSTHPEATSGWRRRNLLDEIRKAAGPIPVKHVVSDVASRVGAENVLVIANETVLGEPLLDRIREKARSGSGPDELPDHLAPERPGAGRAPRGRAAPAADADAGCGRRGSRRTARSPIRIRSRRRCTSSATSASTRSSSRRSRSSAARRGSAATWSGRLSSEAKVPVEHVVVEPSGVGEEVHA